MEYTAEEEALTRIVDAIVRLANPERIILFGSIARGQAGPESDVDLLIVMPEGTHERRTAMKLYEQIRGVGRPFELLVVTPDTLQRYKDNPGLIYKKILREGKEVYARGENR
ncbi:MAG: nucleotidyltransferase domain-containing protein [Rhodothermales bacterium]